MWFPDSESAACSDRTALIEWLRATGRWPEAHEAALPSWLAQHPAGADPALDRFRALAGITPPAADAP